MTRIQGIVKNEFSDHWLVTVKISTNAKKRIHKMIKHRAKMNEMLPGINTINSEKVMYETELVFNMIK